MEDIEKILELSEEELANIFSQMSIKEVEDLINKMKEVKNND